MIPRYVPRQLTIGRFTYWGVYDTERKVWPSILGGRRVREHLSTIEEAQAEVDRVNGWTDR